MKNDFTTPSYPLLAIAIEQLVLGEEICMRVKGDSMLPFIDGEKDSVVMRKLPKVEVGDIVLARISGNRHVLHRVINVKDGVVTMMGDGNIYGSESCNEKDICGTVLSIKRPSGQIIDCRSSKHMRKAAIWKKLLPARRWILAIYRRTYLRFSR